MTVKIESKHALFLFASKYIYIIEERIVKIMRKIKIIGARIIWRICGIHWRIGNAVMDIFGEDNYIKIMKLIKGRGEKE